MKKKKVLVIVAHPDDETIWIGGTLLKNKDRWDITILSLCRKDDKDRAPKFVSVCKEFGAKCFISDLDDSESGEFKTITSDEIISRIRYFIEGKFFDYLFTHGENGEYGHIRHKEIHKAVAEMLESRDIKAKKIFFFSYSNEDGICHASKSADKFIKLNPVELMKKKYLIKNIYGFQQGSFEERCCEDIESFNAKSKT